MRMKNCADKSVTGIGTNLVSIETSSPRVVDNGAVSFWVREGRHRSRTRRSGEMRKSSSAKWTALLCAMRSQPQPAPARRAQNSAVHFADDDFLIWPDRRVRDRCRPNEE